MSEPTPLTRKEAAALCGRSVTTIRRYQREGKLPKETADGRVVVTAADLVACGLLDPSARAEALTTPVVPDQASVAIDRTEVAVLTAKLEAAEVRITELHSEVGFLRSLVSGTA